VFNKFSAMAAAVEALASFSVIAVFLVMIPQIILI
jgi:hypothetical protein